MFVAKARLLGRKEMRRTLSTMAATGLLLCAVAAPATGQHDAVTATRPVSDGPAVVDVDGIVDPGAATVPGTSPQPAPPADEPADPGAAVAPEGDGAPERAPAQSGERIRTDAGY